MARAAKAPKRYRRDTSRNRELVTPEGVSLPLTIASRGARAGALILDLLLVGVLMTATTIALISIAGGTAALVRSVEDGSGAAQMLELLVVLWIILMFLFRNAYFLFFELGPRGATPGKRLAGIRIAARDGGRLTAEMVIARNLLRDIELFLPLVFLASAGAESGAAWLAATAWILVFPLLPLFNRDRLRAGDMIAGTWVVEGPRQKLHAAMTTAAEVAPQSYRFSDEELAVYGEYELQTLERVLRLGARKSILPVHETIVRKIGREGPRESGVGDEQAFLEAYYAQLRARLESGMRMGRRKADKYAQEH
ncbi:RDD family protein [Novosphingobium aquimarinum]|uniref:RDD family protein n=1 Tax=Novosphingobium aquimarinum TaxID=2682494 RepID=UPI0012EBF02A|nr:RDD family protein [Novosphingobium aquimarinum]